jgi:preprotein translocase SecE subunit
LQVRILPDPLLRELKIRTKISPIMTALSQGIREGIDVVRTFLQESWAELRRVQWPARKEVRAATAVVVILIGTIALFLFLVDAILSWLLQTFLGN